MTSPTNRMSGYAYNQAYDAASERNSIFWDALSMTSGSDRNSIAMSIYHSVPELNQVENDVENSTYRGYRNDKVIIIKILFEAKRK